MSDEKQAAEKAADEKPKTGRRKAKESGVRGEWPFNKDHYLATESTALRGHHSGPFIEQVQQELGVKETGVFDEKTRDALLKYQEDNDLPVTGVVDADLWEHFASK